MISGLDHVVLTVRDIEAAADFYARVLGLDVVRYGVGRVALQVGAQKINLQTLGMETRNHASIGGGDLCLLTDMAFSVAEGRLRGAGVAILEGPVARTGARGPMMSLYFNDPDGNLIELAAYEKEMP